MSNNMEHSWPKRVIISLAVALFLYGVAYYALQPKTAIAPVMPSLSETGTVITYTDTGFTPNILTVKKGTTVTFKNDSAGDIRVASNPHPIHDGYPTRGGCISSTFDSCANIAPGQSWSFTFDESGTWGYHNHLNPTVTGTIVVQ